MAPNLAAATPLTGSSPQVVFEKVGVYLHTSAKKHQDPDSLIAGVIRVVEKVSREEAVAAPGDGRQGTEREMAKGRSGKL